MDRILTPLELLRLYYSQTHINANSAINPINSINVTNARNAINTNHATNAITTQLTWDTVMNKGYHSDLAPLLYHILTHYQATTNYQLKTDEPILINASDATNAINTTNATNTTNAINAIHNELKKRYYQNLVRNMLIYQELGQVLAKFNEANIRVMLMKGAALAETLYPNIALRPMGDIDLLIRKADVPRAKRVLDHEGYRVPDRWKEFYERYHFHLHYIKPIRGIIVSLDLHWDVARRYWPIKIDLADLWENATLAKVSGVEVFIMPAEYLLPYLCWHAAHHLFFPLIWLNDISQLIKVLGEDINWDALLEKAKQWKIKRASYYSLHLAKDLFGAAVPVDILVKLRPPYFETRLAEHFISRQSSVISHQSSVFSQIVKTKRLEPNRISSPSTFQKIVLHMLLLDGINPRIGFLSRYLPEIIARAGKNGIIQVQK